MNSSRILAWVTFGYFLSALLYVGAFIAKKEGIGRWASRGLRIFFLIQTGAIILRWVESYQLGIGRAPLTNLYESLILFAWTIVLFLLWLERKGRTYTVGAFVTPLAFLALAYASFSPNINTRIQPLVPALQSNWLIAHVLTCFLGYAAFAVSFALSVMVLIRKSQGKRIGPSEGMPTSLPGITQLDEWNYQALLFGFLLLTVGIATGAVWAQSAWGRYWSWDPKETWSLITWLVYAAILHARILRGWHGVRVAWFSIIGFACVLFTYFGVNFILSGLHSYGSM